LDGCIEICYVSPRELGLFVGIAMLALVVVWPNTHDDVADREKSDTALQPLPAVT